MKFCLLCLRCDCNHFKTPAYLTRKEVIILDLMADDDTLTYEDIAQRMGGTGDVLRLCAIRIYRKLGVGSRRELREWAKRYQGELKVARKIIQNGRAQG